MTPGPGNNGASGDNGTPEGDDPFGYLYADGQAAGATPPSGGGGYGYPGPRASYNQVRPVGERRYGGQQAQGQQGYGYPQQPYGQAPQGVPPQQHGAPPPVAPGGGRGRGSGGSGGPNTRMLLIGAIAVVVAVIVVIAVTMTSGDDKGDEAGKDTAPTADAGGGEGEGDQQQDPQEDGERPVDLPKTDAKALKLEGGTVTASDLQGAEAGTYVAGFNNVGAKLTWTVNGIPEDAGYSLRVSYGVPGKAANATIFVNGKAQERPLNMDNFAKVEEGEWTDKWVNTWAVVNLTKGTNTITLACEDGNECDANFDQMWLKEGTQG
ncbi:carbohydrate-binding protein [Streptomyces sp. NPDC058372]|uniref:carbohydrate-binding protein n=1 Tax=Streptomyces sp. NPDC058372 TaxID=3346464 RepID=UPI003663B6C2